MGLTGPRRLVVEIDELVLDGFPATNRDLVAASFQRELVRLLSTRGPVAGVFSSTVDNSVDAMPSAVVLPATTSARRLGEQLARTVHATLTADGDR